MRKFKKTAVSGIVKMKITRVLFFLPVIFAIIWTATCFAGNKVIVLPVDNPIMLEIETAAFEKALADDINENPALILIEIDTPGGRIDLAKQMCAAISQGSKCKIIAYIKGGQYGGALSAGAAVALACNKIYMAKNSVIGAATLVTLTKDEKIKKKSYEDVVDEKLSSAWRAYLASLAQQNDRPGLLARAMVDRNIDVVEVNQQGKRLFIEPANIKPQVQVVKTWNKSGSLVTLTAEEAVNCTIADGLAQSRDELLKQLQLADANVVVDNKMAGARREFQIIERRADEIRKSLDLKARQAQYQQPAQKALGILRGAKADFENLKSLAQKYPDLHYDVRELEQVINSINAEYENAVRQTRSRK